MLQPYDTLAVSESAVADTVVAVPQPVTGGLERTMLAEDKLPVVLAVVLVIWFGLLFFLFRTDRRLARLERALDERVPPEAL